MRTITVRTLQHELASVFDHVENGEEIHITRSGRMVARIVPVPKRRRPKWPDFMRRLREAYPKGPVHGDPQAFWDKMRGDRF